MQGWGWDVAQKFRESILHEDHVDLLPDLDRQLRRSLGLNVRCDSTKVAKIWEKCANDPEYYIFGGFVRTFDEKDRSSPRKPIYASPHLKAALKHIHTSTQGDVAAVSKSRQMMLSWLLAAYCSWEAKFHDQARVMWQTKKAEDAWMVVYKNSWFHARIAFIERAMPGFMRSIGLKGTRGELWYPNGSIISGIPQGADQLRSYAASLVVCDEACFQPEFEDAFKAALPMAKGDPSVPGSGGRIVLITSAKGGTYYAELVEEEQDDDANVVMNAA